MVNYLEIRKKNFKTLAEVEHHLSQEDVRSTQVFCANRIKWDVNGTMYTPEGEYRMTQYSFGDVLNLGGLPMRTSEKFFEKHLDQGICDLTNRYLRQLDDKKVVKVIHEQDKAYGIVGKDYHLITHKNLYDRFISSVPTARFELIRGQIDPQSMRLDFTDQNCKFDAAPGDQMWPGFTIGNSERRREAINVCQFLWRLVCSNGAIARTNEENIGHFIHRGRMSDYHGTEFKSAIDNVVSNFPIIVNNIRDNTTKIIDGEFFTKTKDDVEEVLGKRRTRFLFEKMMDPKEETLLPTMVTTRYNFGNMITEYAHQMVSVDQAYQLERIGGKVLMN